MDNQIELVCENSENYESKKLWMIHGKYTGQLVVGNEIFPTEVISISQGHCCEKIEIKIEHGINSPSISIGDAMLFR